MAVALELRKEQLGVLPFFAVPPLTHIALVLVTSPPRYLNLPKSVRIATGFTPWELGAAAT